MEKILIEEKAALLQEFSTLTTWHEKVTFWTNCLPINYIQYDEFDYEFEDLYDKVRHFQIEIAEHERDEFSKWVLNNYHDLSKKETKYRELLVIELLQREFQKKLANEVDEISVIRKELLEIKSSFIYTVEHPVLKYMSIDTPYCNYIFNADYKTFETFKDFSLPPDYHNVPPSVSYILKVENGYTLGKYWKYLIELEKAALNQGGVKPATLDQKILQLHYLGAFDKIQKSDNATKKAIFLENLIGNDAERIRQRFSSINDLFSPKEGAKRRKLKEDLEQVKDMFKELGLENIVKNIQADIRKLSL